MKYAGAAALALLLTLQACGGGKTAGDAGRTKVIFGEQRGTQFVAEAAHAMDGAPYDLQWATFATPSVLFEAFRSGAVDVASSNDVTILNAVASGTRMKIVAVIEGESLLKGVGVIVQGSSPVQNIAGLKGRNIVVSSARGGSGDNMLHGALREAGVRPDEVSISYAPFPDSLSAFQSNSIDALVTNDPYLILAEQHGGRILRNGVGLNSGLSLIVASDAALADPAKRKVIADVLQRLGVASLWCLAHPDDYAKVFAKHTGVDLALANLIVQRGGTTIRPVSDTAIATEQKVADGLVERGLWPQHVDLRSAFDSTLFTTTSGS